MTNAERDIADILVKCDDCIDAAANDMLAALIVIAAGLADTGSTPGQHMTLMKKSEACEIARAAVAKALSKLS
jgi:hypothetical protein